MDATDRPSGRMRESPTMSTLELVECLTAQAALKVLVEVMVREGAAYLPESNQFIVNPLSLPI